MNSQTTEKLEVINQFKVKYRDWVNPELISIKYCQNQNDAFLEMTFINEPNIPVIINLDFISDDFDQADIEAMEVQTIPVLFKSEDDIVDNALIFIEFDTWSLINCVDRLFTKEAEDIISDKHLKKI